ncbi:MAG: hypothetical protein FJX47_01100 [Alphaproteobacteria bacterium]|nr:hypothetical protein [Alphaproteobacteria bacterium]
MPTEAELREAMALAGEGRIAEAVDRLHDAPESGNARLVVLFADMLASLGRAEEAEIALRRGIGAGADPAILRFALGRLALQAGRSSEAKALFAEVGAPEKSGDFAGVLDIARAWETAKESAAAEAWYRRAVLLAPDHLGALFGLGRLLSELGRQAESIAYLGRAHDLAPGSGAIAQQLAGDLTRLGRPSEALAVGEAAARHVGDDAGDLFVLGLLFLNHAKIDRVLELWWRVLASDQGRADYGLAVVDALAATDLGERSEAVTTRLEALLGDRPEVLARIASIMLYACDWRDYDAISRRLDAVLPRLTVAGDIVSRILWVLSARGFSYQAIAGASGRIGRGYRQAAVPPPRPPRPAGRRLRVGFLLIGTWFHSTMQAIRNLLRHFDRGRIELYGYSRHEKEVGEEGAAFRRGLRAAFDHFRDLSAIPAEPTARLVDEDDLDILVDCTGLNELNALDVLARRPARITAVYYGFSQTVGADYVDYILADGDYMPPRLAAFNTEHLVRLPGCHMAPLLGDFPEGAITRRQVDLPDEAFVFCNFNNPWKIEPVCFSLWMRLLQRVPGSVLWLCHWYDFSTERLKASAASQGVDPARLIFAPTTRHDVHLARLGVADLSLNNFTVGGGATAHDTLWAGVPMLSTEDAAAAPSARLGATMLRAAGLPELVMPTVEAFERRAFELATSHRDELATLRARLGEARRRPAPLFDIAGAARHLEDAFVAMIARFDAGLAPADIDIAPRWTAATQRKERP